MMTNALTRVVFLAAITLVPAGLMSGPRVDVTGDRCSACCGAWCPFDEAGFYTGCFTDLDATICEFNDKHFLWVGGC